MKINKTRPVPFFAPPLFLPHSNRLLEMARAMKARDPSIIIIASANGLHNAERGQNSNWNRTVLKIAGEVIDFMDAHYYVYGPQPKSIKPQQRDALRRGFLGAALKAEKYYDELRRLIAEVTPNRNIGLVHYEWGVLPRAPLAGMSRSTFLNALATASQLNTFIRNGDLVRGAMLHNFSFYVNPVPVHSEPPNPRTAIFQLYRDIAPGARLVPAATIAPAYGVPEKILDIGSLQNVPEVDVLSLLGEDGSLHVCLLNRNLARPFSVELRSKRAPSGNATWAVTSFTSTSPDTVYKWDTPAPVMQTSRSVKEAKDGATTFTIPPISLYYIKISKNL